MTKKSGLFPLAQKSFPELFVGKAYRVVRSEDRAVTFEGKMVRLYLGVDRGEVYGQVTDLASGEIFGLNVILEQRAESRGESISMPEWNPEEFARDPDRSMSRQMDALGREFSKYCSDILNDRLDGRDAIRKFASQKESEITLGKRIPPPVDPSKINFDAL